MRGICMNPGGKRHAAHLRGVGLRGKLGLVQLRQSCALAQPIPDHVQ